MARGVVLAVTSDEQYYRRMCAELDRLLVPRPVHVPRGEDAVLWVGANHCDLCVIDYDLPGLNGLETLIRIRQRKPGLPVIMTSGANSESIAVSAFRQGIIDYMARSEPDSPVLLADRISAFLEPVTQDSAPAYQRRASSVPAGLQQPTYQNRLRVIGRQLDRYGYRSVNVVEVAGGFLVRAVARGQRAPEALEFPDSDFPHLVAGAFAARGEEPWNRAKSKLLPTGYEDFLRSLGRALDERSAEAVSIAEFEDILVVGGVGQSETYETSQLQPFHLLLKLEDVEYMLDQSFRMRAQQPQAKRPGGLRRFLR
jgi:CheY-like chemotaxis protein